jgi:DNA-binding NtrC family response regulator
MTILIISGIEGVRNCAEAFSKQLEMKVEVAEGRRAALAALRQKEYVVVVVDQSLAECDPAGADAIWERSGLAIPLQINFAVSGTTRIIREIRAALHRREREQAKAMQAATVSIERDLKNTVSGLLLQSQLALSQGGVPAAVAEKLRTVVDLAGTLRQQLSASSPTSATRR